uniref:RNA-binding protein 5 n=1 Tax=Ditylenchus dipsaci TaxID=166011 RepID=A0A915DVB9_9BILA
MSYNYDSNNYSLYNLAAASSGNTNEYSRAYKQQPQSSNQLYPSSGAPSYGQVDKRGGGEMWRDAEKSSGSTSRKRSRTPEKSYRLDRSSRRSRSRSRSPSRHRRRRSRSRSRSHERSTRHRSRSPRYARSPRPSARHSPVESAPVSPKVILISLPVNTDRDIINIMIAKQGFHPIDIRIVRKTTDTGIVRVFGFVEFSDSIQAQAWINYNKGHLVFDDGYMKRKGNGGSGATPSSDWTCSKCTINNFNRRNSCFKCGTSRQDSEALEAKGFALVGVTPCDTLLVRELPASATEESVRRAMSQYTNHVIQRMQIAPSKSYALLQMKSMEDAVHVLNTFNKLVPYVDNCAVIVTFSRQSLNQILIMDNVSILKSQSGITSVNIHQDPINSQPSSLKTLCKWFKWSYQTPNQKTFQLEPVSGYYYDADTAFYYDPKTEYYYNSKTNQWMFWSSKYSTYIPCEGGDLELKKRLQQEEKDDQRIRNSAVISAPPALASSEPVFSSGASEKGAIADALKAALEQNSRLVEALKGRLGESGSNLSTMQQPQQVSTPSFKSPPIPPSPRRFDDNNLIRQQIHSINNFSNNDRSSPMDICNDNSFNSPLKRDLPSNKRDSRTVRVLPPSVPSFTTPPPSVFLTQPAPAAFIARLPFNITQSVGFSGYANPSPASKYPNNETHWNMSRMLENRIQTNNVPVQAGFNQYIGNLTNKTAIANQSSKDRQKKSNLIQKEQGDLRALNICFNCGGRNHQQFSCRFKRISDDHLQQIVARAKERLAKEQILKQDLKKQAESYKCDRKDLLIKRLRAIAPHGKINKEHLRVLCDKCSMLGHSKPLCKSKAVDSITCKNVRNLVSDFSKRFFFHLSDENLIDFSKKFALFDVMDSIENAGVDPVKLQLESLCPNKPVTQKTWCFVLDVANWVTKAPIVRRRIALVKERGGSYKLKPTAVLQPGQKKTMDVITLDDDDEQKLEEKAKQAEEEAFDSDDDVVLVIEDEDDGEMVLLEEAADDEDDNVDPTLVIAEEKNGSAELEGGEKDGDSEDVRQTLTSIVEKVADELDSRIPHQQELPAKETETLIENHLLLLSLQLISSSSIQDEDSEVQIIGETIQHQGTTSVSSSKTNEAEEEAELKSKKKRRKEESEDPNKPKSAQDTAREMAKWARRQEKVKMTFKQPEVASTPSTGKTELIGDITPHLLDKLKKPWGDDDTEENPKIPDAALTSRMRNVGLPLNYQSRVTTPSSRTDNEHHGERTDPGDPSASYGGGSEQIFDEEKFLDRAKPTCLLCRRQFGSVEILNKHVQLSDLHKTNVAAKIRELQQNQPPVSSSCKRNDSAYRDRAKERRSLHGYDPSGLTGAKEAETDVKSTEAIAAYKAAVPLDESNIGNKMLKSMGWSEGQGLGRNLQGIVNPVTAEQRVQGVGLGASGSKLDYGEARGRIV